MKGLRGKANRAVVRVTLGCILGSTGLAGVSMVAAEPVFAACQSAHRNVMTFDNNGAAFFGNFAHVYVNTVNTISGLQNTIARTLSVWNGAETSNVEFGWTAHNGAYANAVPVSDYMVASTTQPPTLYGNSYPLNNNVYYRFKIQNVNSNGISRYYLDGQTSPIGYSPTMSFNEGYVTTNSEHYNTCDTMWTDMTGLQDNPSAGTWTNYSTISCWADTSSDWYVHDNYSNR